ncbi:MAG: hypothetical protein E7409_04445 [Ruminococcaceae bacterium]|nr:hypothetical protein [Oscillospiraceae bacterium]
MKKGWIAILVAICMIVTCGVAFAMPDMQGHWAQHYVAYLAEKGIFRGDTEGNANPDNRITRAEFTALLVRTVHEGEIPEGSAHFEDVDERDWYFDTVSFAYEQGMIKGDGVSFRPGDDISRVEIVLMLCRVLSLADGEGDFPDVKKEHPYYGQIGAAAQSGIITGFSDGTFRPDNPATRAEAAVMIGRMLEYGGETIPKPQSNKLNLTWHQIYNPHVDKTGTHMPGVQIISPTWFQIVKRAEGEAKSYEMRLGNTDFYLVNYLNEGYLSDAKEEGYAVWPLFKNDFSSLDSTRAFLQNDEARWKAIEILEGFCAKYGFGGINMDFENMYVEDKALYTWFVSEMSSMAKRADIKLSVDVSAYHPYGGTWSQCYDREGLGKYADYIMLMAYDETSGGSSEPGPVSSLPWTEEAIRYLAERVPAEKIVLGVPMYARIWKEENGKVTSSALGMEKVQKRIAEAGAQITFDKEKGVNYAQWSEGNATYRVWIEDETSMHARMDLMHKYNLAGVASWSREFPTSDIWELIEERLEQ